MPQTCTVCRHPQRLQVEQAMLNRTTLRIISEQFGPSKTALLRHRGHIVGPVMRRKADNDAVRSATLLDDVRAGEGRAERLYQQAEEILAGALKDRDRKSALQAISAAVNVMS